MRPELLLGSVPRSLCDVRSQLFGAGEDKIRTRSMRATAELPTTERLSA